VWLDLDPPARGLDPSARGLVSGKRLPLKEGAPGGGGLGGWPGGGGVWTPHCLGWLRVVRDLEKPLVSSDGEAWGRPY
jgi:hypothetical protein